MKIIISADYDLYFAFIINKFLPYLLKHDVKIIISEESGKGYGIKELEFFEHYVLKRVVFPFLDNKDIQTGFLTFKQIDDKYKNIKFVALQNINDKKGTKIVKDFEPDVLFSIRNRVIFRDHIIKIPKKGIINIHPAVLPNYRGLITILRAMNNGDSEIGCSVHYITDMSIDTGDIIKVVKVPLYKERSIAWNVLNAYEKGTDILIEVLKKLENNEVIKTTSQKHIKGNYYSYPKKEEIINFVKKNYSFINPKDCVEILDKVLNSSKA